MHDTGSEPAASSPPPPSPVAPRRRPVCVLLAIVLPIVSLPLGLGLAHLGAACMDTTGFKGMALLGLAAFPLFLALPASFILLIVSLCRRERLRPLAVTLLVLLVLCVALMLGG